MIQQQQTESNAHESDFATAEEVVRQRLPDFHFAFRFLPRDKRPAAQAVVAFAAMVREAVVGSCGGEGCEVKPPTTVGGQCCSGNELDGRAEAVKQRVGALYAGKIALPEPGARSADEQVLAAIGATVNEHGIPQKLFADLAEGLLAEAKSLRVATWDGLRKRLDKTAGTTAAAVAAVLGVQHSDAGKWLADLGAGMAVTRMLAGMKERSGAGRVDWPAEDWVAAKCTEQELLRGESTAGVRELVRIEVGRARALIEQGSEGIAWLAGDGSRLAAAVATEIHLGILSEIERAGFDPFARSYEMTTLWRWGRIPTAWRRARRVGGQGV